MFGYAVRRCRTLLARSSRQPFAFRFYSFWCGVFISFSNFPLFVLRAVWANGSCAAKACAPRRHHYIFPPPCFELARVLSFVRASRCRLDSLVQTYPALGLAGGCGSNSSNVTGKTPPLRKNLSTNAIRWKGPVSFTNLDAWVRSAIHSLVMPRVFLKCVGCSKQKTQSRRGGCNVRPSIEAFADAQS